MVCQYPTLISARRENKGVAKDLGKLAEPFSSNDIEWFIGVTTKEKDRGLAIPFITNRAVQDRLDEVCGIDGWKNEYRELREREEFNKDGTYTGKIKSYLCGISIWSDNRKEWITKWDGSDETDVESLKGGLSGAMKRAATQFGIGRYLYKLDSPWVEIEPQGKSYKIKDNQELILPDWALPGGKGYPVDDESRVVTIRRKGFGGSGNPPAPSGQPNTGNPQQQPRKLTEKQVDRALKKAAAAGMGIDDVLLWIGKKFEIGKIEDLNRQQYDALCDALDNAAAKR